MTVVVTEQQIAAAWSELGRTHAGRVARIHLVQMLMAGPPTGVKAGALREAAGRLRLARELLTLMDGNTDGLAGRPTDLPDVVVAPRERAESGARGSGRHVPLYAPDDPDRPGKG